MLTRIRNAQMRSKSKVATPASRMRERVLNVLQAEGYIRGYSRVEADGAHPQFEIELKYFEGAPVIKEIQRISKPGRRVYASVRNLPRVANGLGISILSTPKGVMADHDARENNVGGEVLCRVFSPGGTVTAQRRKETGRCLVLEKNRYRFRAA
jgi:small subunit ribosomal protein S8